MKSGLSTWTQRLGARLRKRARRISSRCWLRAHRRAISTAGSAQGTGGQGHNGDRIPQHVEEFYAVAGFSTRDIVPFNNGADIACAETFFRNIAEQYHVLIGCEVNHTHLVCSVGIEGDQAWDIRSVTPRRAALSCVEGRS